MLIPLTFCMFNVPILRLVFNATPTVLFVRGIPVGYATAMGVISYQRPRGICSNCMLFVSLTMSSCWYIVTI